MSRAPHTPGPSGSASPAPVSALSSTLPRERDDAFRDLLVERVRHDTAARPEVVQAGWFRKPVRLVVLGVAAAAVVATTSAVLVLNDPSAPEAYAAWTAVPVTAPDDAARSHTMEEWASKCSDLGVGGISVQGVPSRPKAAKARDVLVERRGSYTYCLDVSPGIATDSDPLMALSGLRADAGREKGLNSMWGTTFSGSYAPPAEGGVLVLGGDLKTPPPGDGDPDVISLEAFQLYGMAGADVTGVDIVLANGLHITATVQDGIWGAWWPMDKGDPTGSRLLVHAGAATRTVDPLTVQLPWENPVE